MFVYGNAVCGGGVLARAGCKLSNVLGSALNKHNLP